MRMSIISFIILFICCSVKAQEPLVFIEPAHPRVGDSIRIGVKVYHCDTMPFENYQGISQLINIYDNNIQLNAVAFQPILVGGTVCVPPNPIAYYDLGELNQGNYSLAVWINNSEFTTFPFPANYDPPPPYDFIGFSVTAAPQAIETNSNLGIFILMLLLLYFGSFTIKKSSL